MMNPFRGQQIYTDPSHPRRERSNDHEWDNYHQFSRYPGQEAHRRSLEADEGWEKPKPSSQNWQNEEKDYDEDPDGQPYESEEEDDPELARKRKELQVIEEQIMLKKASIALKNFDFKTVLPGLFSEESNKISETLRDKVNRILQLRHPHRFGPKGPLVRTRKQSSITLQHDHPLKRRVKSVLQQRFEDHSTKTESCEQIPFLSPSPPPPFCQKQPSPPKDESDTNQGFMRFLNILNKGVDIDKLSKIVNDDSETPPTINAMPHSDQNGSQVDSALFDSPTSIKTKEEEERQNTDEQQKHLQNILESLGLSLGTDEMSRLADRTQERLYGRRQCTKETTEEKKLKEDETKTEKEDQQQQQDGGAKYSPGHYTRPSSSSSSSDSSIPRLSRSRFRSQSPKSRPFRSRSPGSRPFRSRSRSPGSRPFRSRSRSPGSRPFRSRFRSPKSRSFRSRSRSPKSRSFRSRSRSPRSRSYRSRSGSRPYLRSPSPHRSRRSPGTQNHQDPFPFPPSHPYAYSYHYSSSMHMYPPSQTDPHSTLYNNYLQYASYYNYQTNPTNHWAYNHPSTSTSNNISIPLTPTNYIKPLISNLSNNDQPQPQRCLVDLKKFTFADPVMRLNYISMCKTKEDKRAYNRHMKVQRKKRLRAMREKQRPMAGISLTGEEKSEPQKQTQQVSKEQATQAQATNQTAPNAAPRKKTKKKKKKVQVFVEDADRPERTDGPLTRAFTTKNPEKLNNLDGNLVVIDDIVVPPQHIVTSSTQNWTNMFRGRPQPEERAQNQTDRLQGQCLVDNTTAEERIEPQIIKTEPEEQQEAKVKEEPAEKPVLTDEEIKANLKKKLEAFNNRMKQPFKSPASLLTPKINVEDEI